MAMLQNNAGSLFSLVRVWSQYKNPTTLRKHQCSLWSLSGQIHITKEVTKKSRMLLKYTLMLMSKVGIFVLLQKRNEDAVMLSRCWNPVVTTCRTEVSPVLSQCSCLPIWESIASCSGDQSQERFLEKPRPRNLLRWLSRWEVLQKV